MECLDISSIDLCCISQWSPAQIIYESCLQKLMHYEFFLLSEFMFHNLPHV
jgi:hypothetical protein